MDRTTADARPEAPADRRAARRPRLLVLHVPGGRGEAPLAHDLAPGRTLVGREVTSDLRLDDPRVSRAHAVLHRAARDAAVTLVDEGSRHGTFVEGERVKERPLVDGDLVRLGDCHLLFRSAPVEQEPRELLAEIVGLSPAVSALRRALARVAPHRATVLLLGESGAGKELAARSIHALGGRSGAFVALNCAAIPAELVESQLFGHAAGAFTGARGAQPGYFRAADGGTLFLDEVGELGLPAQAKLLRVLEEQVVTPLGDVRPVACDVRVVAATNRDLARAVAAGAYRGDLHARLAELAVMLPPLRERREDVLLLLARAHGAPMPPLSPELVAALLAYPWPYNVRELFAVACELRVHGAGGELLDVDLVRHRIASTAADPDQRATPVAVADEAAGADVQVARPPRRGAAHPVPGRDELEALLRAARGNVGAVARATGRSRMQVYRWVESHGLDLAQYRQR